MDKEVRASALARNSVRPYTHANVGELGAIYGPTEWTNAAVDLHMTRSCGHWRLHIYTWSRSLPGPLATTLLYTYVTPRMRSQATAYAPNQEMRSWLSERDWLCRARLPGMPGLPGPHGVL